MKIDEYEAHIWSSSLIMAPDDLATAQTLLSPDEAARAARFHFPVHRDRFIAAHSWLRNTLSLYLETAPATISFLYSEHNKPYLPPSTKLPLQFNLSHSADLAVCAITHNQSVGIDIEKMEINSNTDLAKRFFSTEEYHVLMQSPEHERATVFYAIWARKEAILKATGKGLRIPLNQFTVSLQKSITHIELEDHSWSLLPLTIHPDYQAALAMNGLVKKISYWEWDSSNPKLTKEEII